MNAQRLLLFLFVFTLLAGCSKYQKTLKNPDPQKKLELAMHYYNKKDYFRASTLFEQIQENYSGTSMSEKIMYFSAYCNYGLQNYALAGFQFKAYFENFPTGEFAEESLYMSSYCQYLESQSYYLDQTDTFRAIESIRLFVNLYPESKYISECNTLLDKLRARLSYKAYRNAKLYYNIGEYKSAIVVIKNTLRDYPEIAQQEELEYLYVKSHYLLAINSIEDKKAERLQSTLAAYDEFYENYSDSKYLAELKVLVAKTKAQLQKLESKKTTS